MKSMLLLVVLCVGAWVVPDAGAAGGKAPPAGSYGFDSLAPETARCTKLDDAQVGKLKSCTYAKSNSFGDDRAGWACHVDKRDGFMAYATKADCQAELELERANGD